jgi:hypothetical protein
MGARAYRPSAENRPHTNTYSKDEPACMSQRAKSSNSVFNLPTERIGYSHHEWDVYE